MHTHVLECRPLLESLQQPNITLITSSLIEATQEQCPEVVDDAEGVSGQFRKLFTLFAGCHNLYSSADSMGESEVTRLGTYGDLAINLKCDNQLFINFILVEKNIGDFMEAYRLVEKRVTPKVHILEEHIVPLIRKWGGVGVGFHSEQGAESIHTLFNSLLRTYASTRNPTQRMVRVERPLLEEQSTKCCQYPRYPTTKKEKI